MIEPIYDAECGCCMKSETREKYEAELKSTHNTRENFVRDLSESVRYFANVNQYPDESDERKAYLEGVQTAIAMMYIDLTGTPKSEGMLATFLHQELQKARETWLREEIVKLEEERPKGISIIIEKGSEFTTPRMYRELGYARAIDDTIKRYQSELDQLTV